MSHACLARLAGAGEQHWQMACEDMLVVKKFRTKCVVNILSVSRSLDNSPHGNRPVLLLFAMAKMRLRRDVESHRARGPRAQTKFPGFPSSLTRIQRTDHVACAHVKVL